jgi:hypothetical protein
MGPLPEKGPFPSFQLPTALYGTLVWRMGPVAFSVGLGGFLGCPAGGKLAVGLFWGFAGFLIAMGLCVLATGRFPLCLGFRFLQETKQLRQPLHELHDRDLTVFAELR